MLKGKQKRQLRALAHHLTPLVPVDLYCLKSVMDWWLSGACCPHLKYRCGFAENRLTLDGNFYERLTNR